MDDKLKKPLQTFVEGYATQTLEGTDAAIHEYICRKTQAMLLGEAEEGDTDEADKDDEADDEKDGKKKDDKKKDDKKSDDKSDEDDKKKDEDK